MTQASGPWTVNQTQINDSAVITAASGVQKVGVAGAAGAAMDVAQGCATAAANALQVAGVYDSSPPALTNGQGAALLLDANGNLKVNVASSGGSGGTSSSFAATFPATGTAAGAEYLSTAPSYTTSGQMEPLWVNSNGTLNIDAPSGTNLAGLLSSPIPAGVNTIGKINVLGNAGAIFDGATGQRTPANAFQAGAVSSGNLVGIIQADNSVPINVSTATTTQLVPLASGKKIYVTTFNVVAAGTGNIMLDYGTGTNCGTGTTALTGAYSFAAQAGI